MRKLALFLLLGVLAVAGAQAQQVTTPSNTAIVGAYNTSPPTLSTGKYGLVQVDSAGNLKVNVAAGGGSGGTSSSFDAAFPATGTAIGISDGTNMKSWLTALALGDGVNGNNTGAVAPWLYNGTTWDRARGDATNGAWVNVTKTVPIGGVSTAQTSAAASSLVAKAAAGSVISITGSAVSGSYIMVFDATSAPIDGAVAPLKCWGPMAAAGPFAFSWGAGPILTMSTGITVVSSSTGCFTKTATNANFISVEYQ